MNSFLTTAVGLAFTMIVCLYAAHTLLGTWLREAADSRNESGQKPSSRAPGSVPFHTV